MSEDYKYAIGDIIPDGVEYIGNTAKEIIPQLIDEDGIIDVNISIFGNARTNEIQAFKTKPNLMRVPSANIMEWIPMDIIYTSENTSDEDLQDILKKSKDTLMIVKDKIENETKGIDKEIILLYSRLGINEDKNPMYAGFSLTSNVPCTIEGSKYDYKVFLLNNDDDITLISEDKSIVYVFPENINNFDTLSSGYAGEEEWNIPHNEISWEKSPSHIINFRTIEVLREYGAEGIYTFVVNHLKTIQSRRLFHSIERMEKLANFNAPPFIIEKEIELMKKYSNYKE